MARKKIAFYINHKDQASTLFASVISIRQKYRFNPIFVSDCGSNPDELVGVNMLLAAINNTHLFPKVDCMADGKGPIAVQLANPAGVFDMTGADYVLKLEPTTILLDGIHDDILELDTMLIGMRGTIGSGHLKNNDVPKNRQMIEFPLLANGVYGEIREKGGIMGDAYFVKNDRSVLDAMAAKWEAASIDHRFMSGVEDVLYYEDQNVAGLCRMVGGEIGYHQRMSRAHVPPQLMGTLESRHDYVVGPLPHESARYKCSLTRAYLPGLDREYKMWLHQFKNAPC